MLRISLQTLRARRSTLAGAFVAIWLAVTLACATGLLMAGALGAPGAGRLSAADAVVRADPTVTIGRGEDAEDLDAAPAPRLPAATVERAAAVPGVARAIGDIAFAAGAWDAGGRRLDAAHADRLVGHGWDSAALTPFRLTAGRAPGGPRDVVADARLGTRVGATLRIVTPSGDARYRVSGLADSAGAGDESQTAVFFTPAAAAKLSGAPGRVNAVGVVAEPGTASAALRRRLRERLGPRVDVLDRADAADADAGDPTAADRAGLIAIFGALGGIAGAVALFVVAGTFALAIAQRRRETAVLRALGATPRQVRRLIAGEALLVSLVAGGLGLLAGRPLANAIVAALADHGVVGPAFAPVHSPVPLAAALGMGVLIAQLAVAAAARRAGRIPPADALREVAIEHPRPGLVRVLSGITCLAGGAAMSVLFSGYWAMAFAVLGGILLAMGVGLLGRWLLGVPAAALAAPLRRLGASGLLASTGLAANRWRTAALATPIVLVAMLAGIQGIVETSNQRNTEAVTAARVHAPRVLVGTAGAPLPAGTAAAVARLDGVRAVTGVLATEVYPVARGLRDQSPWAAAGASGTGSTATFDARVVRGSLARVRGDAVAVSRVFAAGGGLRIDDAVRVRMADTAPATLRVAAIYDRAAGLGDVILDPAFARRHAAVRTDTAVFVAGGARGVRSLSRYAAARPGVRMLDRREYLDTVRASNVDGQWGVWLVVALAAAFAMLALVNTAAMTTTERRDELATIRLLGGTAGHVTRMVVLEMVPTVLAALGAGAAIVAVAVAGVPRGLTGLPLSVPLEVTGGLTAGAAFLGVLTAAVTARLALRASPVEAMRGRE
jgi:putative ABC transport system permease protein